MTDPTDFEKILERRLVAHAAVVSRPFAAPDIARATMAAAAGPMYRLSGRRGPRRPTLLIGIAAAMLLAVAGTALIGGRDPAIQGIFVDGPVLDEGSFGSAVTLLDGRVLVGIRPDETTVPGTTTLRCSLPCRPHPRILDPVTGALTATSQAPRSLAVRSMAVLQDGRVLFLSEPPDQPALSIYDPVSDRFDVVGAPALARVASFLVTLQDGRVLIGGGSTRDGPSARTDLFDPATGTISAAGPMTRPRSSATAVVLADGRVLVVGGGPEVGASAEVFEPSTGQWRATGDMTEARGGYQTATLLPDGDVLIVGGLVNDPADLAKLPRFSATAEVFDPTAGRFEAVGSMAAPRLLHAAALLSDGTVLVAGGATAVDDDGLRRTSRAELFDPATDTFRPTGDLAHPRLQPAIVAADDRVLLLGSFDPIGEDPAAGRSSEWFE